MPILVNGQHVPDEWIREERQRVGLDLRWNSIADAGEREARLWQAAEHAAVDRMLLEQAAAADPRPIDAAVLEAEVARRKTAGACRSAFDDTYLRNLIEQHLRVGRLLGEFTAGAAKPTLAQTEEFYRAYREQFRTPDRFHASHIVIHVNETRGEEQAELAIRAALAELVEGAQFAAVAERYSDCKGNGGDLGVFPAGEMVDEFERALRALQPGQRTGIFTTPFGFHIALLHSFEPGAPAGFDDVRADIEKVLAAMANHRELLKGLDALRQRTTITYAPAEAFCLS